MGGVETHEAAFASHMPGLLRIAPQFGRQRGLRLGGAEFDALHSRVQRAVGGGIEAAFGKHTQRCGGSAVQATREIRMQLPGQGLSGSGG